MRGIPAVVLLARGRLAVDFELVVAAFGGEHLEAGVGVECLLDDVCGHRIYRAVVCVQQVAHSERLGLVDGDWFVAAERRPIQPSDRTCQCAG